MLSCKKSVDILQQTCYQQANVRMRLHSLRQLDDKSGASCQQSYSCQIQVICRNFLYRFAASCFNKLQQVCKYQIATILALTDLFQLIDDIEKFSALS